MTEALSKIDSAVGGLDSHHDVKETKKPRMSSVAAPGVWNIKDLGTLVYVLLPQHPHILHGWSADTAFHTEEQKIELKLAPETQKTGW